MITKSNVELSVPAVLTGLAVLSGVLLFCCFFILFFQLYVHAHGSVATPFFSNTILIQTAGLVFENMGLFTFLAGSIHLSVILLNNNMPALISGFCAPKYLLRTILAIIVVGICLFYAYLCLSYFSRLVPAEDFGSTGKVAKYFHFSERIFLTLNPGMFLLSGNVYMHPTENFRLIIENPLFADTGRSLEVVFPRVELQSGGVLVSHRKEFLPQPPYVQIITEKVQAQQQWYTLLMHKFRACVAMSELSGFLNVVIVWECVRQLKDSAPHYIKKHCLAGIQFFLAAMLLPMLYGTLFFRLRSVRQNFGSLFACTFFSTFVLSFFPGKILIWFTRFA
jgi:hypothetical protein